MDNAMERMLLLTYLNSFPPGYRFVPTDEELVIHYLRKKVFNQLLPPNKILDIKLYKHSPQELSETYRNMMRPGPEEKTAYFFTPRDRKYKNGTRPNRATGPGYWKATGVDNIIGEMTNPIGYRRALVYYQGPAKNSTKTNWIMHEYRLDLKSPSRPPTAHPDDMKLDDWVLCKVYLKERNSDQNNERGTGNETDANTSSALALQRNNNVPNNFGSTSSAVPQTEATNFNSSMPNNFGSTSFAVPQTEATNYNSSMPNQQLDGSDSDDDLQILITYSPPPTLDDKLFGA